MMLANRCCVLSIVLGKGYITSSGFEIVFKKLPYFLIQFSICMIILYKNLKILYNVNIEIKEMLA
jgi:hypothetical protein